MTAETALTSERCFQVKLWLTFNEPLTFMDGYASKIGMAPSINTPGIGDYLTAHTVIHSHARIYHLYDREFRATQGGTSIAFRRTGCPTRHSLHCTAQRFSYRGSSVILRLICPLCQPVTRTDSEHGTQVKRSIPLLNRPHIIRMVFPR
jgi:hypothetical protein